MDPVSAGVAVVQAAGYCSALISNLVELCQVLQHGMKSWREYCSSINNLKSIIATISERSAGLVSEPLRNIIFTLNTTICRLLALLNRTSRLRITFVLLVKREDINKHFTTLERQKSTLLLYITTETSLTIRTMAKKRSSKSKKPTRFDRGLARTDSFVSRRYFLTLSKLVS